jgi:hypothetical protein
MSMRSIYLTLAAIGAAGGFTMDLLVTSLVFWIYLFGEAKRVGIQQRWVFVALNLVIGLSCALPLFLWARERALSRQSPAVALQTH